MSRHALASKLRELFSIHGVANLCDEVFPYAYRLGRTDWHGIERDVLLCTDLNGASPLAFLLARQTHEQPTVVLAHARTRYTPPDIDTYFATGPVSVVFLADELALDADRLVRQPWSRVAKPAVLGECQNYGLLIDADGTRRIDEGTYRDIVARADDYDLFLDLLSPGAAGRYRAGRRDDRRFLASWLTHKQAWAYAELIERRKPLCANELGMLNRYGSPDKQMEAARRALDITISRYEWRCTKLFRGDDRHAKRYLFQPPSGFRWELLRPMEPSLADPHSGAERTVS